ncbi:MAG TPA: M48 family metalloprotease [Bryobacteraceae bacterium]|nr:M48 family metalloprotease [Bryobacteraceae bacterium]
MKNVFLVCLLVLPLAAQAPNAGVERLLDRIVERERSFLESARKRTPVMETYIQETPGAAPGGDERPTKDHYFLGRFRLGKTLDYETLVARSDAPPPKTSGHRLLHPAPKNDAMAFLPRGFAQMAVIDLTDFNRQTYNFEYIRREFLGEVRCFVFDVTPRDRAQPGKFVGRIWVEDRDDSIVRFNGIYVETPPLQKRAPPERYFHFDSWRVHIGPEGWVPAQVYVEEEGTRGQDGRPAVPRFKAQTRIWDYAAAPASKNGELTAILIETDSPVKDAEPSNDASPLESQRSWEHQAEENLLARLEKGGLLAPRGSVDEVLDTVANNLVVSANLNVEAHCRVMLTTPIETFSIGHTIVISRGLIDVLPDEASLAMVIADELSHIALGHRTPTQFAFNNQTMLSDAELLQKFHFQRTPEEMLAAGSKTIEIMKASPYQKTANAGLFLKELASRGPALPRLLQANLGNQFANADALKRLEAFAASAPELDEYKIDQITALPLGSRVKVNPWNNQIVLVKTRPISLLSPREKMPFEITPFALYLTRVGPSVAASEQARQ